MDGISRIIILFVNWYSDRKLRMRNLSMSGVHPLEITIIPDLRISYIV